MNTPGVLHQRGILGESIAADVANMILLLGVRYHVHLQFTLGIKARRALTTDKRLFSGVSQHVISEGMLLGKALPTDGTSEWVIVGMIHGVVFQVCKRFEFLTAERTFVGPFGSV